jgi:hypothetical protein
LNSDLTISRVLVRLTNLIGKTSGRSAVKLRLRVARSIVIDLLSLIISGAKIYPGIRLILRLLYNGDRKGVV